MVTLRRFVVLLALFFWQGGFTFYAAVVVPAGTEVLQSARRQGFVTRRVTHWLNITAAVALVPLAWDTLAAADPAPRRKRARLAFWFLLALCQAGLFALHAHLDAQIRPKGFLVPDPEAFYPGHRAYLWLHTVQWGFGLAFLLLTLLAWRSADQVGKG